MSQHIQNRPHNPHTVSIHRPPLVSLVWQLLEIFICKYLKQAACTMSGPQPIKYQRDLCHPSKAIWCLLINALGKKLIWLSNNSHINFCHWLPTGLSKEPSLLMLLWRPWWSTNQMKTLSCFLWRMRNREKGEVPDKISETKHWGDSVN